MKKEIGLWIDHHRAIVVTLSGNDEKLTHFRSDVEAKPGASGGAGPNRPYGPMDINPDNRRDRQFNGHLSKFYEDVVHLFRDADSIFILGPGEAKGEFRKHLDKHHLGGKIVGMEAADKMTDHEIVEKIRTAFHRKTMAAG